MSHFDAIVDSVTLLPLYIDDAICMHIADEQVQLGIWRYGKLTVEGAGENVWVDFHEASEKEYNFLQLWKGCKTIPSNRFFSEYRDNQTNQDLATIVCGKCRDVHRFGNSKIENLPLCEYCG